MKRIIATLAVGFVFSLAQAAEESSPAPTPPKTFTPTEQIDPDSAVAFPVDI